MTSVKHTCLLSALIPASVLNPLMYKTAVNGRPSYKIAGTVKPYIKLLLLLSITSGYSKRSFENAVDVNGSVKSHKNLKSVFFFNIVYLISRSH